ncbi:MAG TPA: ROK family protein [Candidatus Limnocylindria bacterium]|nr:ROK family protein [Candidatus Limnocylindria bacterium]
MTDRWAIGLDLGGTDLKAGWVDAAGGVHDFFKQPSRTQESAEAPLEALAKAVAKLRRLRPNARPVGVGVGSPGVIDPRSGAQVGRTAHLPHWQDFPLRDRVAERLGLHVTVDNDANLAALAETRLGAGRGARVALMVTLGTGIGCGIVVEGDVLRGAFGGAGEIGHLPFGSAGRVCPCGVAGCAEPEASARGLEEAARAAGLPLTDATSVFAAAGRGEPVALGLADRMADRLGAVLATAINLLNPDVVVIGGGGAEAGEPLLARVRAALDRYALASHRQGLRVVRAALGERAGVAGAGLLAFATSESAPVPVSAGRAPPRRPA